VRTQFGFGYIRQVVKGAKISLCNSVKDLYSRYERRGFLVKRCIRFLICDKSREGSSPYGRGLGILAS